MEAGNEIAALSQQSDVFEDRLASRAKALEAGRVWCIRTWLFCCASTISFTSAAAVVNGIPRFCNPVDNGLSPIQLGSFTALHATTIG
jgi:hypothetical protein